MYLKKNRNRCLESYVLCSSHYLSAPALSWDAMLSMTKVEVDFISDVDKYLVFEKRLRGGVSYISKRYSISSSKYLRSYGPKIPTKYTIYLDKNNLFVYAVLIFSNGWI